MSQVLTMRPRAARPSHAAAKRSCGCQKHPPPTQALGAFEKDTALLDQASAVLKMLQEQAAKAAAPKPERHPNQVPLPAPPPPNVPPPTVPPPALPGPTLATQVVFYMAASAVAGYGLAYLIHR